jgi:SAM-dependent methyltransferase
MDCCAINVYNDQFNARVAAQELRRFQEHGPRKETRLLLDASRAQGLHDATRLDIGGGIGAIQHGLVKAGVVNQVTDVDASMPYLNTARSEAERRHYADRAHYLRGNFVDLAPMIDAADIVTLDRVICCYPDMHALAQRSVERARRIYAVVYPRGGWGFRVIGPPINGLMRLLRQPLPIYIHANRAVDGLIRANGLIPVFHRRTLIWQVAVYTRLDVSV